MKACQLFLDLSKRQRPDRVVIQTLKWTKLANFSISPYEKLGLSEVLSSVSLILLSKSYFIVMSWDFVRPISKILERLFLGGRLKIVQTETFWLTSIMHPFVAIPLWPLSVIALNVTLYSGLCTFRCGPTGLAEWGGSMSALVYPEGQLCSTIPRGI